MRLRLACQTITFGPDQGKFLDDVFSAVASAGYDGVEVGFRHMEHLTPAEVTSMLAGHGLTLAASHVGGNLEDAAQAESERGALDVVLEFLAELKVPYLMYSGLKYTDDDQFRCDLDMLNRAAVRCREHGVHLLYHNHNWEFADGMRVMDALLTDGAAELGFCPDVGWVVKGGADLPGFLDRAAERIGAIHFKDFATMGDETDAIELGNGIVPWTETAAWIAEHFDDIWIIAEQDTAAIPPEQAIAANAAFCRDLFGRNAGTGQAGMSDGGTGKDPT